MTLRNLMETNIPLQVMYYDGENMCPGILFRDEIICACCGGVSHVDDVIENAKADGVEAIRVFRKWTNFSDEIKGDDETAIASSESIEI